MNLNISENNITLLENIILQIINYGVGGIVVALFSGNKFLHAKRSNKKNIKARKFVDEQIKELEKEKK